MSYKIKSFLFLSCFIAAFAIYNLSVTNSDNNYSDPNEIAIVELEEVTPPQNLQVENPK